MLHKKHSRSKLLDQFLNLKAGIDVYVIEGFIPHIHMGPLTKAAGQQYLFLLSGTE